MLSARNIILKILAPDLVLNSLWQVLAPRNEFSANISKIWSPREKSLKQKIFLVKFHIRWMHLKVSLEKVFWKNNPVQYYYKVSTGPIFPIKSYKSLYFKNGPIKTNKVLNFCPFSIMNLYFLIRATDNSRTITNPKQNYKIGTHHKQRVEGGL